MSDARFLILRGTSHLREFTFSLRFSTISAALMQDDDTPSRAGRRYARLAARFSPRPAANRAIFREARDSLQVASRLLLAHALDVSEPETLGCFASSSGLFQDDRLL